MSNDKFEIRITKDSDGSDTKLDAMSVTEAKAFARILVAMNKIVESFGDEKLKISVHKGSAAVAALGTPVSDVLSLFYSVRDNKSDNAILVEGFRDIQSVFTENGLSYDAKFYSGNTSTDLYNDFVNHRLFRTKSKKRHPEVQLVFIKGKLLEVGGLKPNFHILPLNAKKIKIECTESDATRVNAYLYKDIYLSAWRYKRPGYSVSHKFCDHYIEKDSYDWFKNIVNADLDHIAYVGHINDSLLGILRDKNLTLVRAFMKLYNHESVDNSILKMILILTKYFKDHSNIMDIRKSIKSILEKKRNAPLI